MFNDTGLKVKVAGRKKPSSSKATLFFFFKIFGTLSLSHRYGLEMLSHPSKKMAKLVFKLLFIRNIFPTGF